MARKVVVIPTYNERDNIARIVPQVLAQDPEIDVLVVDDSSPDGTSAVVESMQRDMPRVHLLTRPSRETVRGHSRISRGILSVPA